MDKSKIELLPLTKSQTSLWLTDKLHLNLPINNDPYAFYIKGEIDIKIFKLAFKELLGNTDVLRAIILEVDGKPYQKIAACLEEDLLYLDFEDKKLAEVEEWLRTKSKLVLDTSKKLFDSALIRLKNDDFIWYLNLHHLITDATSRTILFNRMSYIYEELLNFGTSSFTEEYKYNMFIDFEEKSRDQHKEKTKYWENKIKSFTDPPSFYGLKKVGNVTEKSHRIEVQLSKDDIDKLTKFSENPEIKIWNKDVTLLTVFASVLFSYLYRVSGQRKLIIGIPIHNRINKAFQETVGLFIEIFPLTVEIDENETFISLLKKIQLDTIHCFKNGLIGTSSANLSRSYNVILNYINSSYNNFANHETITRWIHPECSDPAHKLRFHIHDFNNTNQLNLIFDFNEDILVASTPETFLEHFENVFNAFLADINQPIDKPSIISKVEKSVFTETLIDTSPELQTVIDAFEDNVKTTPNAIALQFKSETLTYKALNKKANQLANYLIVKGAKVNDNVVVHSYRNSNYIISVLAILKIGGTFIPIASDQTKNRIDFILENCDCAFVLTQNELLKNFSEDIRIPIINLQEIGDDLANQSEENIDIIKNESTLAYVLYTSGSTGLPKGVLISNRALSNYIFWAKEHYGFSSKSVFALFTSIGFDLTITSTFLPLVSGGRMIVYEEDESGIDISVLNVIKDNLADTIKLTPSHLSLFQNKNLQDSNIKTMIVGGEDFKVNMGKAMKLTFGNDVKIFNEYGPTEATVGCIVSEFNPEKHKQSSIPIGLPITNMNAYILDEFNNLVPKGVVGELYLSGSSLASGYLGLDDLTTSKFIDNPFVQSTKMYKTGDLARINSKGEYEYLGRVDEQVKLRGYRIELPDIESNLLDFEGIDNCAVVLTENTKKQINDDEVFNCIECGLPSNYPQTDFDAHGVCNLCNAFKGYKNKAQKYFKTESELHSILTSRKGKSPSYDCLTLLSGGKDSTYILAQLVSMGLKVLAFTLDNGYISEQAKDNINRIVSKLGVDHIYGQTEHMNAIFVDSLYRHKNVCNGCFKTIYTLSTKIAMERQIPFIVTGLSRGQFFETRLTEELFWDEDLDVTKIDDTILEVRKLYHREEDAIKELLDVSIFEGDDIFETVQFVDFYRYSDVSLENMIKYLEEKVGWIRPTDTGRSTNCLINQVGIYVHKRQRGYSNYSFPYSWDVRLGHKTRDESLEEINEYIDEVEVKRIMAEIGYEEPIDIHNNQKLVAYYTGDKALMSQELKMYLSNKIPDYMIPSNFKYLEEIPLTKNGKIDKKTLRSLTTDQLELEVSYVAPRNEIEQLVESIWKEVLRLERIGVHDDFIALGGHSLAAIRVTSRINEELELNVPLNKIFNLPTIERYSEYIEDIITKLLNE
ncbi:non-ribosomal peptide synthetase [Hyunsoonleella pacifica]|uniref:Amino acid adenylation domain-containing protein n=1 Tax=Hyunsoonleella pacifica TaxID=1080224 RepID=A0A4V2JBD5_9FLAO|nr:non-ribosomal peptide synthetase [Hyunsoonleella pacifica]TBN18851.1 amino acid adenylation domain-containing protein [Hyunsoonleella pacifica]GGD05332.1 hypothetical protein GCM10011368_03890 [Hyunsoonleella pacifica]